MIKEHIHVAKILLCNLLLFAVINILWIHLYTLALSVKGKAFVVEGAVERFERKIPNRTIWQLYLYSFLVYNRLLLIRVDKMVLPLFVSVIDLNEECIIWKKGARHHWFVEIRQSFRLLINI